MKIVCPQCDTAYDVTPASLGAEGRQVRCARCQSVWYAEPPQPAADIVTPAASEDVAAASWESSPPFQAGVTPVDPSDLDAVALRPESASSDDDMADSSASEADADIATPPEPTMTEEPPADCEVPEAAVEATSRIPAAASRSATSKVAKEAPSTEAGSRAARTRKVPPPKRQPWHTRGLSAAIVVLAVVDAAIIAGRADIVKTLPQTASLFEAIGLGVNLRDLTFKDITTKQERHDGATILVVEGKIVSTGRKPIEVPRLRFAISAGKGHEIYAWTSLPPRTRLAPGETLRFRTRLASPPEQGRSIKIRFFNRRDIGTGLS